jgi:hypothetical protein
LVSTSIVPLTTWSSAPQLIDIVVLPGKSSVLSRTGS